MNHTSIEWAKNPDGTPGYTCNPKTGCLNHTDGLCKGGGFPCYAYKLANTRLKERYLANKNWDTRTPKEYEGYPNLDPFYPRWWPEKLEQIRKRKKPAGIFLDDMSDWMGDYWSEEWTRQELQVMRDSPQHRFYTLTKQPQNLPKWLPFPDNCWVGVTVTDSASLAIACGYLRDIKASIKYLSIEPYLGMILATDMTRMLLIMADIRWLIIGAQTKPYKPPRLEWVKEIATLADKDTIPLFLKDNIYKLAMDRPAEDHDLYWEDLANLRQEFPGKGVMV